MKAYTRKVSLSEEKLSYTHLLCKPTSSLLVHTEAVSKYILNVLKHASNYQHIQDTEEGRAQLTNMIFWKQKQINKKSGRT